jgi:hypothetical protein
MEFILTRDQRDEIMKATAAIHRQVKEILAKPSTSSAYVIATNLAIIQMNLTNLPTADSN